LVLLDKWRDLSTYYGDQWPYIDRFARALLSALKDKLGNKRIPIGEINSEFAKQFGNPKSSIHPLRQTEWIDNARWESPPIDERLFVIGCLGYELDRKRFFPWAGRNLDRFRLADSQFVSPVFS